MEANEGHDEGFGCEDAVLGEAQNQTLEHFVTDSQTRFPQDGSQVVTTGFTTVSPVVLAERNLKDQITITFSKTGNYLKIRKLPAKSGVCGEGRERQLD